MDRRVGGRLVLLPSLPAPMRSIVSTSKDTPAARRALVTTSAGAEGSAPGSFSVTRVGGGGLGGWALGVGPWCPVRPFDGGCRGGGLGAYLAPRAEIGCGGGAAALLIRLSQGAGFGRCRFAGLGGVGVDPARQIVFLVQFILLQCF
jgi:hypothetical protein